MVIAISSKDYPTIVVYFKFHSFNQEIGIISPFIFSKLLFTMLMMLCVLLDIRPAFRIMG